MTILLSQTEPLEHLASPDELLSVMVQLRESVRAEGQAIFNRWRSLIHRPEFWHSAQNLADYLALREQDLRQVQAALMPWGLSSLGRIEARVMPNLDAVIATLGAICHKNQSLLPARPPIEAFFEGHHLLTHHTNTLFGYPSNGRKVRIMVTLPTIAAEQYEWVKQLLQAGVDCVRINCAHDSEAEWDAMIAHVHRAAAELSRPCKIMMDLAGPKPRTGTIQCVTPEHQRLTLGQRILLTRQDLELNQNYTVQLSCTLSEVLDQLQVGDHVWIDDGKFGAVVEEYQPDGVVLAITHVSKPGKKVKPDKGLNFPSRRLSLTSLTHQDRQNLDFVIHHADMIGYSFVQDAADIVLLQQELGDRCPDKASTIAIIAKIETPEAVHQLPEIIVHAAGRQPFGVMIARGDLAVEIGYQRLAEIQEEILWICEAAHIPVIWATQVLENLVKTGTPSRAEITDAAMSERAECVMLNKGPHIEEAVAILKDVLGRMQEHQFKKMPQLRALKSWQDLISMHT
jgi:pyruvate kinase